MVPEQVIIIGALAVSRRVSYLLVFSAGIIVGLFGGILLGQLTSWISSRKRTRYREFKLGDDLFNVEVPDFMPRDGDSESE